MATHEELQEILEEAADKIHDVIKNGYQGKGLNLPALDPLPGIPDLSKRIDVDRAHVELTLKNPQLTGLNSISIANRPKLDMASRQLSFGLHFDEFVLSSDEFDMEGTYRILFKHNIDKEGAIEIRVGDVTANMVFAIGLSADGPEVVADGSEVEIGKLKVDIEDSIVLDLLIPFFKGSIAQALSGALENTLEGLLTDKLRGAYEAQRPMFDKMVGLYNLKKEQGLLEDDEGNPEKPRALEGFGGVGQFPLPLFWEVPEVPVDELEHIDIPGLLATAKTGDVIMFSGVAASSRKIRRWTQSPFSHVVVLIKEEEFENSTPLLWQSTSSTHRGVLVDMQKRPGVQLNQIEEMIQDYLGEAPGANIVYRSLIRPERDAETENEFREAVSKLIHRTDGFPYTDDMWGLGVMGLMEIDVADRDSNFFCAGLVAQTLIDYGILKDALWQHQYAPRDFCSRQQALPFVDPAMGFGPEIVIDV